MNMKKVCAIALLACGGLAFSAGAEGLEVQGDASVAVASSYFWRGKEIHDSVVLQPEVTLGIDRWTISVSGTWDMTGESELSARTRIDAQADYGIEWKNIRFKAGAAVRTYHNDPADMESDTCEVYAHAAADMSFCPSVTIYYDLGKINGLYAQLSAGETWKVHQEVDLVLDVGLGLASSGFVQKFLAGAEAGPDGDTSLRGGVVDLSCSLSAPVTYRKYVITPMVEYVTLIDSALRDAVEAAGRNSSGVIGSLTVSRSF